MREQKRMGVKKSLKDILHLHNSPEFLLRALTLFPTRFCEFLPNSLSWFSQLSTARRVPTFSANKSKCLDHATNTNSFLDMLIKIGIVCSVACFLYWFTGLHSPGNISSRFLLSTNLPYGHSAIPLKARWRTVETTRKRRGR